MAYTIASPDQVIFGTHVASIIDAVTGAETAHFVMPGGRRFSHPIGIPLCSGCDGALDDEGYCASCEEPAHWRDTIRQALLAPRSGITARVCMERSPETLTEAVYQAAGGQA